MLPQWKAAALILTLLISSGCGVNRRYAHDTIRQLPHSSVAIRYIVKETDVQTAAAQADGEGPAASSPGERTLTIIYPHSNPKLGRAYAEATLRGGPGLNQASGSSPSESGGGAFRQFIRRSAPDPGDGSVLHMSLKYDELEHLLDNLIADGFFDREEREGGVDLDVTLGSRSVSKGWDRIATLDELVTRIQTNSQRNATPTAPPRAPAAPAELLPPRPDLEEDSSLSDQVELVPGPARF